MPRRIMLSVFRRCRARRQRGARRRRRSVRPRAGSAPSSPNLSWSPVVVVVQPVRHEAPIIPYNLLPNPPWNRGNYNYGSSWSFYYPGPYYGGPYDTDGARLPYVCGFYGYC